MTNGISVDIYINGFGTRDMDVGYGAPLFLELYEGELRLVAFRDIRTEEPTILNLDAASESHRQQDPPHGQV